MVFSAHRAQHAFFNLQFSKYVKNEGELRFITGSKHHEKVESTGPYRYSLKASGKLLLLYFERNDAFVWSVS